MIYILGTEADDIVEKVQLKIEKSKIYKNLDILVDRENDVVIGSGWSMAEMSGRSGDCEGIGYIAELCFSDRKMWFNETLS